MPPKLVEVKVGEAIQEFLIERRLRNLSPETITWYEKRLRLSLGHYLDQPLSAVELSHVKAVAAEMLEQGRSAGTVNGAYQAIKALLNWAIDEDIAVGFDPRRLKALKTPQRLPRILDEGQIQALLGAINARTLWGRRDRMIVLTFLDTGCRLSELIGMNVEDVDVPLIKVTGKGNKQRLIALSLPVQREMLRWLRIRNGYFEPELRPLFPCRNRPYRLNRNRVDRLIKDYGEKAKLPFRVTPHIFRHTFSSFFLNAGGSIVHLQQLLGHSDITMSRRYAQIFDVGAYEASMIHSPISGLKLR